jgi:Zn-dependent peptidase ImmA (M78 family)
MFSLDRMAIEEAGPNSERLANAIHLQLGPVKGSVQLTEIAIALNIIEIRYAPLQSFEGALLTTPERRDGSIIINSSSRLERQRFTLAHELGHYLNVWHEPPDAGGFMCKSAEVRFGKLSIKHALSQHEVQELQANQFAIELIAPKARIAALSNDDASVRDVLRIATELELSKEAAARRYVELHPSKIAVVFTLNGEVKYSAKSSSSPRLAARKGDRFLTTSTYQPCQTRYEEIEVDLPSVDGKSRSAVAGAETYYQQAGHAFTILNFEYEPEADGEDDGIEDTFNRFSRF